MAEFLFMIDPARRAAGHQIGDPVMIEDDGHVWGAGELDTSIFRIVRVPTIGLALARAVFFRDGVPRSVRKAEDDARAAVAAALAEVPRDETKIATLRDALRQATVDAREWPRRRFHVDLSALGSGNLKTATKLRDSSVRKGNIAWRDAIRSGSTRDVALAAAIAAATPVTDFNTAVTEE